MANKNDEKILELKKVIQEKKDKLGKIGKFIPETNCSLALDGVQYNLNVLGNNREGLIQLLVKLTSLVITARLFTKEKDGFDVTDYNISGYNIEDWIKDVKSKLDILSKKDEEKSLVLLEAKLEKMLSDEKQVELELDSIANLLK